MYVHDSENDEPYTRSPGAIGATAETTTLERVVDVTQPPYRWICALDVSLPSPRGQKSAPMKGTGVLISPRHVLTAAHNVTRTPSSVKGGQFTQERVEALRVTVTPGLDSTSSRGKARAPVGSMDLKPGDWWIPSQYPAIGVNLWDFAVLTLPKELPQFNKMTYGHWSDPRYAPRTSLAPVTGASLVGSTVSFAGYVAGNCRKSCTSCDEQSARPDSIPLPTGWLSTQAESFGQVVPGRRVVEEDGVVLFTGQTCLGMAGSPVWQKSGSLRLVAINLGSNLLHYKELPAGLAEQRFHVGLLMRDEIVKLLRQRLTIDHVMPTF